MIAVAQIALIGFLVIGAGAVLVAFVRGVRAKGFPDRSVGDGTDSYRAALGGPRPVVPPPAWTPDSGELYDGDPDGQLNR
ncbi:hypothetical protein KIH27_01180 [Mycobacterium sp. M1]|uniref:Secreted protein n=1 Tax=Mycolicibacter acidiphilus TaxID=2835306 RepID=A0ABS5RD40_9MYCO|nr:hypothetical protein [Mycolicibacter acidiphilus]MBS9532196.1 hypothetical protein [Mycolicibacter acidiphilus]